MAYGNIGSEYRDDIAVFPTEHQKERGAFECWPGKAGTLEYLCEKTAGIHKDIAVR